MLILPGRLETPAVGVEPLEWKPCDALVMNERLRRSSAVPKVLDFGGRENVIFFAASSSGDH